MEGGVFLTLTLLQCLRLCEAVIAEVSFQDGPRSSVVFASPAVCAGLCWRSFECVGSRSLERLHRGLRGRAQNRGTKQGHPKWLLIFCTLEAAVDGSLSTAWVVSADGCSSLNNAWRSWPTKLRFVRKSVAKKCTVAEVHQNHKLSAESRDPGATGTQVLAYSVPDQRLIGKLDGATSEFKRVFYLYGWGRFLKGW